MDISCPQKEAVLASIKVLLCMGLSHEKVEIAWLVKKFPTFCGTGRFVTVFIHDGS
jgi:hypothetical protein